MAPTPEKSRKKKRKMSKGWSRSKSNRQLLLDPSQWYVNDVHGERIRNGVREFLVEWDGMNPETGEPWDMEWKAEDDVGDGVVPMWEEKQARNGRGHEAENERMDQNANGDMNQGKNKNAVEQEGENEGDYDSDGEFITVGPSKRCRESTTDENNAGEDSRRKRARTHGDTEPPRADQPRQAHVEIPLWSTVNVRSFNSSYRLIYAEATSSLLSPPENQDEVYDTQRTITDLEELTQPSFTAQLLRTADPARTSNDDRAHKAFEMPCTSPRAERSPEAIPAFHITDSAILASAENANTTEPSVPLAYAESDLIERANARRSAAGVRVVEGADSVQAGLVHIDNLPDLDGSPMTEVRDGRRTGRTDFYIGASEQASGDYLLRKETQFSGAFGSNANMAADANTFQSYRGDQLESSLALSSGPASQTLDASLPNQKASPVTARSCLKQTSQGHALAGIVRADGQRRGISSVLGLCESVSSDSKTLSPSNTSHASPRAIFTRVRPTAGPFSTPSRERVTQTDDPQESQQALEKSIHGSEEGGRLHSRHHVAPSPLSQETLSLNLDPIQEFRYASQPSSSLALSPSPISTRADQTVTHMLSRAQSSTSRLASAPSQRGQATPHHCQSTPQDSLYAILRGNPPGANSEGVDIKQTRELRAQSVSHQTAADPPAFHPLLTEGFPVTASDMASGNVSGLGMRSSQQRSDVAVPIRLASLRAAESPTSSHSRMSTATDIRDLMSASTNRLESHDRKSSVSVDRSRPVSAPPRNSVHSDSSHSDRIRSAFREIALPVACTALRRTAQTPSSETPRTSTAVARQTPREQIHGSSRPGSARSAKAAPMAEVSIVTLPIASTSCGPYLDIIDQHRNLFQDYRDACCRISSEEDGPTSDRDLARLADLGQQIDLLFQRLLDFNDLPACDRDIESMSRAVKARRALECSAKFVFVLEYLNELQAFDLTVAILSQQNRILDTLVAILEEKHFKYKRLGTHNTMSSPSRGESGLRLLLGASELDPSFSSQKIDFVVVFDQFSWYQDSRISFGKATTVLHLIYTGTLEHIDYIWQQNYASRWYLSDQDRLKPFAVRAGYAWSLQQTKPLFSVDIGEPANRRISKPLPDMVRYFASAAKGTYNRGSYRPAILGDDVFAWFGNPSTAGIGIKALGDHPERAMIPAFTRGEHAARVAKSESHGLDETSETRPAMSSLLKDTVQRYAGSRHSDTALTVEVPVQTLESMATKLHDQRAQLKAESKRYQELYYYYARIDSQLESHQKTIDVLAKSRAEEVEWRKKAEEAERAAQEEAKALQKALNVRQAEVQSLQDKLEAARTALMVTNSGEPHAVQTVGMSLDAQEEMEKLKRKVTRAEQESDVVRQAYQAATRKQRDLDEENMALKAQIAHLEQRGPDAGAVTYHRQDEIARAELAELQKRNQQLQNVADEREQALAQEARELRRLRQLILDNKYQGDPRSGDWRSIDACDGVPSSRVSSRLSGWRKSRPASPVAVSKRPSKS